jgi:hypothetical protein
VTSKKSTSLIFQMTRVPSTRVPSQYLARFTRALIRAGTGKVSASNIAVPQYAKYDTYNQTVIVFINGCFFLMATSCDLK